MDIVKKRAREKAVVALMIKIYAQQHDDIVANKLLAYVNERIDKCPLMAKKTFCSRCKIHCYQTYYRQQIKKVMRYSGPRLIFYHPLLVIKHMMKG